MIISIDDSRSSTETASTTEDKSQVSQKKLADTEAVQNKTRKKSDSSLKDEDNKKEKKKDKPELKKQVYDIKFKLVFTLSN